MNCPLVARFKLGLALKYGDDVANNLAYIDNMKWVAKQAWAGKTFINIGPDIGRLANPSKYKNAFKVCRGELIWYNAVMGGKIAAFWSHRLYRLTGGY